MIDNVLNLAVRLHDIPSTSLINVYGPLSLTRYVVRCSTKVHNQKRTSVHGKSTREVKLKDESFLGTQVGCVHPKVT